MRAGDGHKRVETARRQQDPLVPFILLSASGSVQIFVKMFAGKVITLEVEVQQPLYLTHCL